jgi:hypothetical protein
VYGCLNFHKNFALFSFYLLFCLYFMISAIQIRYGLPYTRKSSSLATKVDRVHQIIMLLYCNIPFLLELKAVLDWCFTKTGLDLLQWF